MSRKSIFGAALAIGLLVPLSVVGSDDKAKTSEDRPAATVNSTPASSPPPEDDLLIRRERYFYSSFSRRDPFKSLVSGSFDAVVDGELLDIGEITLVGVVWGEDERFAVVQDKRDHVYTLREGDRVVNGKVTRLTRTSLTAQHYFFGETASVTIHLNQGEGAHETR